MPSVEKDPHSVPPSQTEQERSGSTTTAATSSNEGDKPQTELDSAAQALIGHHLRTLYGEIVREPVPDQFLKLLQDLERKERE
jgi:hypothetical protein